MRLIDIISSATSNMLRSKVRTFLTIIAIFVGAFTISLTMGISSGVTSYIDKQVNGIGAKDVLIIRPKVSINTSTGPQKYNPDDKGSSPQAILLNATLSTSDIDKIKTVKNISNIKPVVLVTPNYISGKNGDKYKLDIQLAIESTNFEYLAGKLPDNKSTEPQILLSNSYVSVLGYSSPADTIGKTVTIGVKTPLGKQKTVTAIITGVQQDSIISQGGLTVNDTLINELHAVQVEGASPEYSNRYIGVTARFDNTISDKNLQKIKDDLNNLGYMGRTINDQIGIIKNIIDAITSVLIFFGAIALLAASFGIINTLFMSVQERTKEIGLMKAMGMSRAKVFLLFSFEAIMLGFWGSLIGAFAAISAGQVINKIASDTFLKDLPGFDLTIFPVINIAIVMTVIMFIAFLAGTLPARRAANQDPISALRYE